MTRLELARIAEEGWICGPDHISGRNQDVAEYLARRVIETAGGFTCGSALSVDSTTMNNVRKVVLLETARVYTELN